MSDFQIVRLKGGYRVHRKIAGEMKAICGAQPREVVKRNRSMRSRAGWWIYDEAHEFNTDPRFNPRCKICFKKPD